MMNKLSVALICIFIFTLIASGLVFLKVDESYKIKETALNNQISTLNSQVTQLSNDNLALTITSNLKAFPTLKALQRFLSEANAPMNIKSTTYPSETCIELMKEAKLKGYWMGITSLNTTDESFYSALYKDRVNPRNNVQWHSFCIAIVGDSDLYLIDSQNVSNCYFIVSLTGDFAEYNSEAKSNVDNLKIH
jgi:hypothetical protein